MANSWKQATVIIDQSDPSIGVTVFDRTNSNPLAVQAVDSNGSPITTLGNIQYTEGDTDTTITGTAIMWEDASDTLRAVSAAKPLPISVASLPLPSGAATLAEQQTQTASLSVMDDWDETDRAKVNIIVGQAGVAAGTGVDGATVPRVTLATNVALPAGTNLLGKVSIDQTTPGTTNLVALTAETTKVIGVVRNADGSGNLLTSTGNALDINLKTSSITLGVDTELTAAAAMADDVANPTIVQVATFPMVWDPGDANWDRARGLTAALNQAAADSGIQAVGVVAQFDDVAPTAITENQFGNIRMSANRNLYGTIRDAAGNERGANVNASNQLSVSVDNTPTVDTELPAAAALSDSIANPTSPMVGAAFMVYDPAGGTWARIRAAVTNADGMGTTSTVQVPQVNSVGRIWNGTNFDRVYEIVDGNNTTGTGVQAMGIMAQLDDTSPTAITENRFGNLRMGSMRSLHTQIRDAAGNDRGANVDASGNLMVNLGKSVEGENQTYHRMMTLPNYSTVYISTAATTTAKSGSGVLHTITVNGGTAGTIIGYDNTAGSGTILFSFDSTNALATYHFDIAFSTGLTIVTGAATKITVSYI